MNKKEFALIIILISLLFLFPLITAADEEINNPQDSLAQDGQIKDLREQVEQIQDIKANLSDEELRTQYLKGEWGKLLNKTSAGPYIQKAQEKIDIIDPVIETVTGLKFTFSWFFFLTIYIYIWLLTNFYDLSLAVKFYAPRKHARVIRWGVWFIFLLIISSIRIPRFLAALAIDAMSIASSWGVQIIMLVILIVILVFVSKYVKFIRKAVKKGLEAKAANDAISKTDQQGKNQEKLKEDLKKGKYDKGPTIEEDAEQQAKDDFEGLGKLDD